jgi:hypothetical protein
MRVVYETYILNRKIVLLSVNLAGKDTVMVDLLTKAKNNVLFLQILNALKHCQ